MVAWRAWVKLPKVGTYLTLELQSSLGDEYTDTRGMFIRQAVPKIPLHLVQRNSASYAQPSAKSSLNLAQSCELY